MADVGVAAAAKSGGLVELSKCQDTTSERDCQRIMVNKYRLSLDVKQSLLETKDPDLKIPVLKMKSWADFLARNNCWHMLTGLLRPDKAREERILNGFWENFQKACPQHDVFKLANSGQVVLSRAVPICLHGDEGRGRKHKAFLVCSFRSLLGRGLEPSEKHKRVRGVKKPYIKQLCNYRGHSFTNRFMIAGLRKPDYCGSNDHVFDSLMTACAFESKSLATEGFIDAYGVQRWLVLLYVTGDWPWLVKSGKLTRSFNCVMKRKEQQKASGICHQCLAGQDGIPWEQIGTKRPHWLTTEFSIAPFDGPSVFQLVPHCNQQLSGLWTFDFFHTWHLGVCKYFLGGALALLSMVEDAGNIDMRFHLLSERYKSWCSMTRHRSHIQKLTKECLTWPTTRDFPVGSWHKGELSTVLMKFLEATLYERTFTEPLLEKVKEATDAIHISIRKMYRGNLWLSPAESHEISGNGLRFLRRYEALAHEANQRGLNLFGLNPKLHCLHKIFLRVHFASIKKVPCLNPLAVSCQQCEDFIGRPSRLSRRVAGGEQACDRVFSRYLQACYAHWTSAGYLVRPD